MIPTDQEILELLGSIAEGYREKATKREAEGRPRRSFRACVSLEVEVSFFQRGKDGTEESVLDSLQAEDCHSAEEKARAFMFQRPFLTRAHCINRKLGIEWDMVRNETVPDYLKRDKYKFQCVRK